MRTEFLVGMKLEGKEVINEQGSYLGSIVGVNGRENTIIIKNTFEKKFSLPLQVIVNIGDNVVVREER